MANGNTIENWIESAKIMKKHGREPFFGVGIQAGVDDGSFFVVIFNKMDNVGMKGALSATKADIDKLRELGVTITDKGGWLK